jgi:hypothetical protein
MPSNRYPHQLRRKRYHVVVNGTLDRGYATKTAAIQRFVSWQVGYPELASKVVDTKTGITIQHHSA